MTTTPGTSCFGKDIPSLRVEKTFAGGEYSLACPIMRPYARESRKQLESGLKAIRKTTAKRRASAVGFHPKHSPAGKIRTGGNIELLFQPFAISLNRLDAQVEQVGDFFRALAPADKLKYLQLAIAQAGNGALVERTRRIDECRQQPVGHCATQSITAVKHRAHALKQSLRRLVFHQV